MKKALREQALQQRPDKQRTLLAGSLLALSLAAGCRSFGPVTEATRQSVAAMPLSEELPAEQFVLELESPVLTGVFDVLFAREASTMRLQLFPDVGGKVLDLTIGPDGITAWTPTDTYRARPPLDAAEPHLGLALGMMLSELVAPVTAQRLLGERLEANGTTSVQLVPAIGAGRVTATLSADGRITGYDMSLGWLRLSLDGSGAFAGRGFSGRLSR